MFLLSFVKLGNRFYYALYYHYIRFALEAFVSSTLNEYFFLLFFLLLSRFMYLKLCEMILSHFIVVKGEKDNLKVSVLIVRWVNENV